MSFKRLIFLVSDSSSLWWSAGGAPCNSSGRCKVQHLWQPEFVGSIISNWFLGPYLRCWQKPRRQDGDDFCGRDDRSLLWVILQTLLGHWLVVSWLCTLLYLYSRMYSSSTPTYLHDLIQPAVPVRPLRFSDAPLLSVARTRTEFALRAFWVAAPHT